MGGVSVTLVIRATTDLSKESVVVYFICFVFVITNGKRSKP